MTDPITSLEERIEETKKSINQMKPILLILLALMMQGCEQRNTCPCVVTAVLKRADANGVYYDYRIKTKDNIVASAYSSRNFYSIGDTIK